jgi:hypothetical protein
MFVDPRAGPSGYPGLSLIISSSTRSQDKGGGWTHTTSICIHHFHIVGVPARSLLPFVMDTITLDGYGGTKPRPCRPRFNVEDHEPSVT